MYASRFYKYLLMNYTLTLMISFQGKEIVIRSYRDRKLLKRASYPAVSYEERKDAVDRFCEESGLLLYDMDFLIYCEKDEEPTLSDLYLVGRDQAKSLREQERKGEAQWGALLVYDLCRETERAVPLSTERSPNV